MNLIRLDSAYTQSFFVNVSDFISLIGIDKDL